MKLIDLDALFDEKLAEYMRQNAGKYNEKQWESIIPKLYKQFGDIVLPQLKDTPKGYYEKMTDGEIAECLSRHVEEGVPVSDFLCRELEKRRPKELIGLLSSDNEELLLLAVNLIGEDEAAFDGYFRILSSDMNAELKDAVADQLKKRADAAKDRALSLYRKGVEREIMLELLSRCKERDEAVYDILLTEFKTNGEIPMRASYLAAYGDPRALPALLEVIDREDINFIEYQELKFAIEALGGEYTRPRDFSSDPYFDQIMAGAPSDLFKKGDDDN